MSRSRSSSGSPVRDATTLARDLQVARHDAAKYRRRLKTLRAGLVLRSPLHDVVPTMLALSGLEVRPSLWVDDRVIVLMGSNPRPDDGVAYQRAYGSIMDANSGRVDHGILRAHWFEVETGMPGILLKESVGGAGLPLHVLG